jgi:hypothetical protein
MNFVSKNLALKLKEKGFDKPCFGWYYIETPTGMTDGELILDTSKTRGVAYKDLLCSHNANFIEYVDNYVDAPTIDQVLEWLREEKYINFGIFPYTYTAGVYYNLNLIWKINPDIKFEVEDYIVNIPYKTYDDACIAGIEYVIENLI